MQISDSAKHEIIDEKKPIDDLCAEFASFIDFDDSVCCTGCDGDMLCNACAEIAAFLRHDESFSADYGATQSAEVVKPPKFESIVAKNLLTDEEERLLPILRENLRACTLADIPSISHSICMRRILLEDGVKPIKQPPRRLNPLILDVVIHYTGCGVAAGTLILLLSIGSFLSTLLFHFSICCFLFVFTILLLFLVLFLLILYYYDFILLLHYCFHCCF